jgi:uncharacterized protein
MQFAPGGDVVRTRTELDLVIDSLELVDTHEHLFAEDDWAGDNSRLIEEMREAGEPGWGDRSPDILQDLFFHYPTADLAVAGASPDAIKRLFDPAAGDIESRFSDVREAWEAMQHTGYGEGVRLTAREVYGLDSLTAEGLEEAQRKLEQLRQPGEMYRLLASVARLDHVQIHDFERTRRWKSDQREFFLHDLCWWAPCRGEIPVEKLHDETGIEVTDLESLREAFSEVFRRFGPTSIAVKSAHAYHRTLTWTERSDADAGRALAAVLATRADDATQRAAATWPPAAISADALVLGDWCLARGVELAIEHNLPFKLHTGYRAGTGNMPIDWLRAANLCPLLTRYPEARFVLMHTAYPYTDELIAIAKHYRNVWVDLCWAWSIDRYTATDFVRRFLHAVPANKLFVFGGDTFWPTAVVGYSIQARRGLRRALGAEVASGDLTDGEAIDIARRLMRENQYECFDIQGTRAAIQAELVEAASAS